MEFLKILNFIMSLVIAMTTENEGVINILFNNFGFPFIFIEATVTILLSTAILDIASTTKQKVIYVLVIATLSAISNSIIPKPYGTFIHMILTPIAIMIIFKINFFKAIIAELFPFIITALLETIISKIIFQILHISYDEAASIPIYRIIIVLLIYFSMYILYRLSKKFNFNIKLLDNFKNKNSLLINFILGLISIGIQFYLIVFYNNTLPFFVILLSTISLLAYFIISIYSLSKTTKLEITTRDLEVANLYNESLIILYDSVRVFKHDFSNILQSMGGYIDNKDIVGLNKYYSQLMKDFQRVNNLATLNPKVINNPAIYGILASKYLTAYDLGIQIDLEVFLDLNKLNMQIYEFSKVLGILLDNAIEAVSKCEEKIIKIEIRKDFKVNRQLLIISNTYANKDVDLDKIFEKGYTSKTTESGSHGLGLSEVRQILKKHRNLNLYTTKTDKFFTQQFEIY